MDDHQTYGDLHGSRARAYLVYNATDTVTVKGGMATAFLKPRRCCGLTRLDRSCRSCSIVGNPDLKPETSESSARSTTAGRGLGLKNVEGSITFQNNVDDMIDVLRTHQRQRSTPGYPNSCRLE